MNGFPHWLRVTSLLILLAISFGVSLLAQSPSPLTERAGNPALERFGNAITFYLSFDGILRAELANGKPDPSPLNAEVKFFPGLYGQAVMLMGDGSQSIHYAALDNVDLSKPGALALWTSPREWVRGDEEDYLWPANVMASGAQLLLGRQGRLLNPRRRDDMLYLWAKVGETRNVTIHGGSSLDWKNGEWHLWVANWRSNSIEFSMDGGPLQRQDLPAWIDPAASRAGHLFIAHQTPRFRYLLDELIAFNRPLDAEEIKWLYEQGMKAAGLPSP
jgi:hypothetical protein